MYGFNLKLLKRNLSPYLKNIHGWRTHRKIVVIESDDWGSIRMPSRDVYEKCLKAGYKVDQIAYEKYDSLASEEDLELLYELLNSFTDQSGNHPVITANALVANPDFDKIRENGFEKYEYELLTETFKRYPKHSRSLELWKQGMREGIFFPQSHGREHLNVSLFMKALQTVDSDVHFSFEHEMPGSIPYEELKGNKYVESLKYTNVADKQEKLQIILEGLELFEQLFGYRSESLIPPNYLWSSDFDEAVSSFGVRFYQGNRKMKEPKYGEGMELHPRRLGEKNRFDQIYLVRNALFEPSLFKMEISDPVEYCLRQIRAAFRMKKPAVICSHRINYVGYLFEENRDRNLDSLKQLLQLVKKEWPDIEFMNSVELGNLISEKND